MGRFTQHVVGTVLLIYTLGIVHAQSAELLLVHLLPDSGEAEWLLNGEPIDTTAFNETEGYLEIPVTKGTLTARIDGVEARRASFESRDEWRYVAYLHEGPDGTPAVIWTTGHVVVGMALPFTARGVKYFRLVNLVPSLSDVQAGPGESCPPSYWPTALPYGAAHSPGRLLRADPGPSTICAGGEKVVTLPAADEDDPENWHVALNRVTSIVLYQHDGQLEATIVDETPELR